MNAEQNRSFKPGFSLREAREYKPATSKRLMLGLRANLVPFVSEVHTQGEHNLDTIPEGVPIIWAMTHATSDVELQSAMLVVADRFDTVMTDHSSHHSMEDPIPFISQSLAGMDNFYPISYKRGKNGEKGRETFRVTDFVNMLEAFQENKAVAIAAHNPVYDSVLPDNAGAGMVALASFAASRLGQNALIVPVAMDFHENESLAIGGNVGKVVKDFTQRKRIDVTVHVGAPMQIDPVDMETYLLIRAKHGSEVTSDDVQTIKRLNAQLRAQGGRVMESLAGMLPEQKRGKWADAA